MTPDEITPIALAHITCRTSYDTRQVQIDVAPNAPLIDLDHRGPNSEVYAVRAKTIQIDLHRHGGDPWSISEIEVRGNYTVDGDEIGMTFRDTYRNPNQPGYTKLQISDLPAWVRQIGRAEEKRSS